MRRASCDVTWRCCDHDVVTIQSAARRETYACRIDCDHTIPKNPTPFQEPIIGQDQPVQLSGIDDRADHRDIVDEGLLRFDKHDFGEGIQRSRQLGSGVAAADDHNAFQEISFSPLIAYGFLGCRNRRQR